ncbi:MAG: hypothetical protein ACI84C_000671 [Flavobacteriales bacterium]|jgi:hypothetical protein
MVSSILGLEINAIEAAMFHKGLIQVILHSIMWTTEVKLPADLPHLNHQDSIVLMGSCFSSEIGGKLERSMFTVNTNEFGVIFHPIPICRAIDRALDGYNYSERDLIFAQGKWHSTDHQSHVSHENKDEALRLMNICSTRLKDALVKAKLLVLTLGTSWGYLHKMNDLVVANCHRIPQAEFSKELSSKEELVVILDELRGKLSRFNPSLEVIYTVSPVRHWKDGGIENSNSKSELIAAVHNVSRSQAKTHYFPAYEIMIDELRDYRFYKDDMLHPSSLAVSFIWDKFQMCVMDKELRLLNDKLMKHARIFDHRDESEAHLSEKERVGVQMKKMVSEFYGTKKG